MKIVFMGTPDFAVAPLKSLIEAGHEISLVVTMPDKPKGRGYELIAPPVKTLAIENNIEVIQPLKIKDEYFINKLKEVGPDVFVVVAYGKILPKEVLEIPRLACINIHASLLPAYRGAAPIQWAVIDGLEKTGISTMLMDTGLDTGDILKQYIIDIDKKETAGSLFDKLAFLGGKAIVDTLENLTDYMDARVVQGDSTTDYASMLSKADGELDFSKSAIVLERLIRGLNPWPSAFSFIEGRSFKIWDSEVVGSDLYKQLVKNQDKEKYGKIILFENRLFVVCKDSLLELLSIQIEGKKRMNSSDFLRGYRFTNDMVLGR